MLFGLCRVRGGRATVRGCGRATWSRPLSPQRARRELAPDPRGRQERCAAERRKLEDDLSRSRQIL